MQPERESNYSPSYTVQVWNSWSFAFMSLMPLHGFASNHGLSDLFLLITDTETASPLNIW